MSSPFVAEIRIVGFNFAPTGWATCDGQLLPLSQNTALFSLLGTYYGGDGKSTFALPNLQGSIPIHQGQGPGLSEYFIGQSGGTDTVTLLNSEMPVHNHTVRTGALPATGTVPSATAGLTRSVGGSAYKTGGTVNATLSPLAIGTAGGSQPHNNLMPYLAMLYIIALQGVFPPRQ